MTLVPPKSRSNVTWNPAGTTSEAGGKPEPRAAAEKQRRAAAVRGNVIFFKFDIGFSLDSGLPPASRRGLCPTCLRGQGIKGTINLPGFRRVEYGNMPGKGVPTMLEIKNLTKSYGDVLALDRFSLELWKGRGAGPARPQRARARRRSISILAGTLRRLHRDASTSRAGPVRRPRDLKNRLGIVPQDMAFYEELSAMDNLLFWGGLYDVPRADLKKRAAELLELVELAARAKEPVKNFSGGMKRRLNTAIGLLHKPDLLLLDEPTVGIDVQAKVSILDIIRDVGAARHRGHLHHPPAGRGRDDLLAHRHHGPAAASWPRGRSTSSIRIVGEKDIVEITGDFAAGRLLGGRPGPGRRAASSSSRRPTAWPRWPSPDTGRDPDDHGPPVPAPAGRHRPEDQVAQPGDRVPEADRPEPEGLGAGMRRLLLVLANDVRRHLKSPLAIVIYIAIPMVMTALIGIIFAPGRKGTELPPIQVAPRRPRQGPRLQAPAGGLRRRPDQEDVPGDRDRRGRGPEADDEGQGLGHGRHPREASPSTCSTPRRRR
ncbi:MAG: ATP-binding cassette domain-containing protein [Desulfosudis oleivorans]|nr:ATP-binding cassette domain-containing protein [Desulfosudis oleivorans]